MILSGNAIDHALLMLAGVTAGIPVAPISVAYSLQSQDHGKLKDIAGLLTPGLVYVADTAPFAKALAALDLADCEVVANVNGAGLDGVTPFDRARRRRPGRAVEAAVAAITPDTIVKFLFTSGSTGIPKGVINTHRMLTANQQQMAQVWPFLAEQDLVMVDWMPWNHTFGGNHDINMVLRHAGTLYIDAGRPVPALLGETLRNLKEVSPTIYLSVPAGYAALLPHLETDEALARSFFARLRLIFYAGAALPQDLWTRLEALARARHRHADSDDVGMGNDRDVAGVDRRAFPHRPGRHRRRSVARRRDQARPGGRQDRGARARAQCHAGLLEAPRPDGSGVRRGRLLQARRCDAAGRSARSRPRGSCSTAGLPRTSS